MTTAANDRDILALRLASQLIDTTEAAPSVVQVVERMLAMQAQDFEQALWAVGVRAPGATRSGILDALDRGLIVRSLPMRGTLHFVLAEDLGWMLGVTAPRSLAAATTRFRSLGLDDATLVSARAIAEGELAGGGRATRAEFLGMLERAGISTAGQRGYHIIFFLAQHGVVCWGPPAEKQQALVLLDEWVAHPRVLDRESALAEFALRYLTGHGPATERDFAWWTKLTLRDARAGVAAVADRLERITVGDDVYWFAGEPSSVSPATRPRGTHLLPGFEEYLLGYRDRSAVLPAIHADRIVPGSNGIFLPIVVVDGRVVGTWRRPGRETPSRPSTFAIELFDGGAVRLPGLADAERAYRDFLA